jgi:hypothetical protein
MAIIRPCPLVARDQPNSLQIAPQDPGKVQSDVRGVRDRVVGERARIRY